MKPCPLRFSLSCSNCAKPSTPVKLVLIGGDSLVGWTLRSYVELLSARSQDWIGFLRIYVVPLGGNNVARHLASLDAGYATLFPPDQELKGEELAIRIHRYISSPKSAPLAQLPLAEAMLNCQDDPSQTFVPFVNVSMVELRLI